MRRNHAFIVVLTLLIPTAVLFMHACDVDHTPVSTKADTDGEQSAEHRRGQRVESQLDTRTAQGPFRYSITVDDPVGDHRGSIDVVKMVVRFSVFGDYLVEFTSTEANPFDEHFAFAVNLRNVDAALRVPDSGNFRATAALVELDAPTTVLSREQLCLDQQPSECSLAGFSDPNGSPSSITNTISEALRLWRTGDHVFTNNLGGNPSGSLFRSSVSNFPRTFLTNEDTIAFENMGQPAIIEGIPVVPVEVDIKPGNDSNTINCRDLRHGISYQVGEEAHGLIIVAILTTDNFDATMVDHSTVVFERAREAHRNKKTGEPLRHEDDINHDGRQDLVFHFRPSDTILTCDSDEGMLTGFTFSGELIEGSDAVRMIGGAGSAIRNPTTLFRP